jgi:restriction endonuclease S subunit
VLSCRGTILRIARVGGDAAGALASANVIVIRPEKDLSPAVPFAWLRTRRVQDELLRRARSSTGQISLTVAEIAALEVPVPPMAEQERLAALIEGSEAYYAAALRAAALRRRAAFETVDRALNRQA